MNFLSIVVPVFNSESYIERTIRSIASSIKGSENSVEVLFVDDGSTDNSVRIIKRMIENLRNFKLVLKKHTGVSETRNLGLSKADGEYISFFDSDDVFNFGYISRLSKDVAEGQPDFVIMDADRNFTKSIKLRTDDDRLPILEALVEIGRFNCSSGPSSKFYRKDFLVKNRIRFNSDLVIAEDLMFNFDVVRDAKNVVVDHFDFYKTLDSHSMHRFKAYNLQNEMVFNQLLSQYFGNLKISRKKRPLLKLKLTGFMFLLNWYFDELIKNGSLSFGESAKLVRKIAEKGEYTEAFKYKEFDSIIGKKHAIFRKLMNKNHYGLVLMLNRMYWKIKQQFLVK